MTSSLGIRAQGYLQDGKLRSGAGALLGVLVAMLMVWSAGATMPLPGQTTFPATTVGQSAAPVLVTLTAAGSGAPNAPSTVTEGVSDPRLAEFTVADAGTCGTASSVSPGTSCTVSVVFTPRYPGMRHGAVVVTAAGGQLLASSLLSGIGQGSLPVLIPGQISTVAGNGQWFYQGDGMQATQAALYLPSGLAVDGAGNLYLADTINNRVRRVDAITHTISTVAGNGNPGSAGDGGPATSAQVTNPTGIALDGAGNLYIADTGNHAIRRVDAVSGTISTVAGTPGTYGYSGDGGVATAARLNSPQGVAVTPGGDLIIADTSNAAVRVVTVSDGLIQTVAGTGTPGYNGEGLTATSSQLNDPSGVAVRADGALAIADLSNNRVRLMTVGGTMTTLAGTGAPGYSGDGGPAAQAGLQGPAAIAFDPAGDLLIADSVNNCLRLVYGSQTTIMTLAGTPNDDRYAGDGGPAKDARMHGPDGLFFDATGNLWISDRFNNRVREIYGSELTIGPYPTMKVGKISQPVAEGMINAGNQPLVLSSPVLSQTALDGNSTTCGQSSLGSATLCTMGLEFAPTTVGNTINGSITWTSNAPNVTPVDYLYGEVLTVEPTSTVLTADVNPTLLGQSITLTAAVTSDDRGRTGTVDFVEGSTTWCSARPVGSNGTATCQVPGLALGVHSFLANYSGDNNNAASQSPAFQETVKQQAALALGVSSSPAAVTSNITITLTARDSTGTPSGTAVLLDGAATLATLTLDSVGQASWSTNALGVGQHVLTAQYSGDSANMAETSGAVSLEIDQVSTLTVLSSSNDNAPVGSTLAFTANVVSGISQAPTGSVQLLEGANVLASAALAANGSANFAISALAPGTHALKAVYSGDAQHAPSSSAGLTQHVQQIVTVTTLGADVDPLAAGAPVALVAMAQMAPGLVADGPLTGTMTFTDEGSVLGTAPINASGQAMLSLRSMHVGVHHIVASFGGSTNYAASQSAVLAETVQQTASTVALSTAASSTLMGKPATFAAAVTSATGIPTGTITFRDGPNILGTVALDANGKAGFVTTQLPAGNHLVTAAYSGDANYVAASSASLQVTVSLAQPVTTLSAPGATGEAGLPVQLIASLASPGVAPTGTITLFDGASSIASQPVSGTGTFLFATSSLGVGVHALLARYGGDADNAPAASAVVNFTVQQAGTATALHVSANPLTQGQVLSLNAAVTSDNPYLTGQVNFFDGPVLLGSRALGSDGQASFTTANLALGMHSLTAAYAGDVPHAASSSPAVPELVVQALGLTVSASANPSVSGQSVVFTGRLTGSPVPTGSLSFRDGSALLATVPVDGTGAASFATSVLGVGVHTLQVSYSGDTHFSATTAAITQTVLHATTEITLTVDNNPGVYGNVLTLASTVTSNGGAATGSVSFTEAGVSLGSAALDAAGTAVLRIATLSPGTHNVVANYLGDGKASPSGSAPLVLVVKQATTLAMSSGANPTQTLTPVSLTASVSNAGAAPATGSVTFTEGPLTLGTAQVSAGKATLSIKQMTAGSHEILASYGGDGANFASQSAVFEQVVQLRPTTTTVTGTGTDTANPQQMTLIAVVHGDGSVPPGGTVNFTSGTITLGAAQVDSTGVATITVIFETPAQQVVASYQGDDSYSASQSAPTPITAGTPAQFTLALSSTDLTLVSHQKTTITVTLSSVKGFTDNISLGCLGLPYAATCTFDKTRVKLNADGTVSASLIVDTGDPLGAGSTAANTAHDGRRALMCFAPLGLLLGLVHRRGRRKRVPMLLALVLGLLVSAGGLTGCGGLQMSGTPAGSYSFRVMGTGQGSNVTELQTVNLVVTQ